MGQRLMHRGGWQARNDVVLRRRRVVYLAAGRRLRPMDVAMHLFLSRQQLLRSLTGSLALIFAAAGVAAPMVVHFEKPDDRTCRGTLAAEPICPPPSACRSVIRDFDAARDLPLELSVEIPWKITASARGCWAAPVVVPTLGVDRIDVRLWPEAHLRGTLPRRAHSVSLKRLRLCGGRI